MPGQTLPDSGLPMLLLDCAGIATRPGSISAATPCTIEEEEADAGNARHRRHCCSSDLDGGRRAVPLAIIDRVEQVDGASVRFAAGRMRCSIDGRILPLAVAGRDRRTAPRLSGAAHQGRRRRSRLCDRRSARHRRACPRTSCRRASPGRSPGVVADRRRTDRTARSPMAVRRTCRRATVETGAPLCLIDGDTDGWIATFLQAVLEAAGYRVATQARQGRDSRRSSSRPRKPPPSGRRRAGGAAEQPTVPLSGAGDDSVYRYDRAGLLAAVAASAWPGRPR